MIIMSMEVWFLGAELCKREDGTWIMTKANYIRDLLKPNFGENLQNRQNNISVKKHEGVWMILIGMHSRACIGRRK